MAPDSQSPISGPLCFASDCHPGPQSSVTLWLAFAKEPTLKQFCLFISTLLAELCRTEDILVALHVFWDENWAKGKAVFWLQFVAKEFG